MIATDPYLGVRPSLTYKFMIILGPSGPYFSAPMKILIEQKYTRATPGGVGFAKNGGNYGASLHPVELAKKKGFDQILWTDANEHKYVEEPAALGPKEDLDSLPFSEMVEVGLHSHFIKCPENSPSFSLKLDSDLKIVTTY